MQYHTYQTPEEYQRYVRESGKPHDVVKIGGYIFTMDNYDQTGHEISYGNVKNAKQLIIATADRYAQNGFADAVVTMDDAAGYRDDITYIE